jgi:two-component system cell cycle sensor histidine kinase/response regulator CckA
MFLINEKLKMDNIFKNLYNRKNIAYTIIIILFLLCVMIGIAYQVYNNNKNALIGNQQQQMLAISKSTCQSLKVFITEKVNSVKILTANPEFAGNMYRGNRQPIQATLKAYFEAQKSNVQRVGAVNQAGKIICLYPNPDASTFLKIYSLLNKDIAHVLQEKKSYISRAVKDEQGRFVIYIYEPVLFNGKPVGMIISTVSVAKIYQQLVKYVKSGKKGYVMIKDQDRIILMHPAKEQVGMDVIKTRKQLFPDFYFKGLEELIKQQYTNTEGTAILYSYWWTDKVLKKTKKLNAFSRVHIGDYFWVVTVTMSYNEIESPIRQNLITLSEIFSIIIIALASAIFIILKIQKNKEALEVETKYLKELNSVMEELNKKDIQLQHSQKLQLVGTLTGGIAHEFNNLLTPILGYAEILKSKTEKDSEAYDQLNEIYDASRKAKDIIEQILVFSRSDDGKTKYRPIQVNQLVEQTLNLVKSTITPNVEIIYENKTDGALIMANRVQIHQVIFNLCTNAFHAVKYAGGVITVSLAIVKKDEIPELGAGATNAKEYIMISVNDTGYGMSKETLAKIFEPFFTTKPEGEGTGLGLFIVQKIVENHHGVITVKSEIRKGSTFKVYLPKIEGQEEEPVKLNTEAIMDTKSVLLVDDQPKVLHVMKKAIEQYGFKVIAVTNGVEALKIFNANPSGFDIVITDQIMPYLKGVELAERLKAIRPEIKIILITGFVEDLVLEYKERMIIDEYISKPATGESIARIIHKVLHPN